VRPMCLVTALLRRWSAVGKRLCGNQFTFIQITHL
jgi:hypothetical protein